MGFEMVGELYDPSYRWNKLPLRGLEVVECSTTLQWAEPFFFFFATCILRFAANDYSHDDISTKQMADPCFQNELTFSIGYMTYVTMALPMARHRLGAPRACHDWRSGRTYRIVDPAARNTCCAQLLFRTGVNLPKQPASRFVTIKNTLLRMLQSLHEMQAAAACAFCSPRAGATTLCILSNRQLLWKTWKSSW